MSGRSFAFRSGRATACPPELQVLAGSDCHQYRDFFDHRVPLSDRSLREVLELIGMQIRVCHPRFLPYTMKSRLPNADIFVRWYLRAPWLWRLLGKQVFVVAEKPD